MNKSTLAKMVALGFASSAGMAFAQSSLTLYGNPLTLQSTTFTRVRAILATTPT